MKTALIIASVASMIDQFNMSNIRLLLDNGFCVDVAANFKQPGSISERRAQELQDMLENMGIRVIHTPIPRSILSVKDIYCAYKQIKTVCKENQYNLVHCHSPIGSVVARCAAASLRKNGTKVIYTAHGFHFYKGAPLSNWILFYPIEKLCSYLTDLLITINLEDYEFARKRLSAKTTKYIPGVGIDTKKFSPSPSSSNSLRSNLILKEDDVLLLSVGELNKNKNHQVIFHAIADDSLRHVHYCIVGQGILQSALETLAQNLGILERVHFLGFRSDVANLYNEADCFVFPSFREGLSVALMEAMSSGLPCIASKIRGNIDLIVPEKGGYLCQLDSPNDFRRAIQECCGNATIRKKQGEFNRRRILDTFAQCIIDKKMDEIYEIYGKKTVMHLLNTGAYSGAENVVITIMKNMKHEVNPIYVSLDGPIRKILEREGLQFYALNKLTRSSLRKAIYQLQPDIIHAHDFTAGITAAISTRSIPIINHLHHNAPWIRKYGAYSFIYALASTRIAKILAVSNAVVKEYVFGKIITHKSLVVGNPVDFKLIRNKARYAIENNYSDIIFIGRLSEAKNPLLFIDIIDEIVKSTPNLKVAIVGDGNLREVIETSIESKGLSDIVKIYGFLENPYGLLANSKLLCMTSTWEGFGLVAVEALSLGTPVIASQVGGLPDIVDETCGALCNNKDEYVENILHILSSDSLYNEKTEGALRKSTQFDNLKEYMSLISQAYW